MRFLLDAVYLLLIIVVSPWLIWKSIRTGKYRTGYASKLVGLTPKRDSDSTCIWFHAVSVGEVNLLATLIDEVKRQKPDWECVISTTTITGMELALKKFPGTTIFFCPLDFSWATRAAVRRIRPDMLVLIELELWPNLIKSVKSFGASIAVVNGRLSEHSFVGYCRVRPLVTRLMQKIDLIAAQDHIYADRFMSLGARPESVQITGSMKYDGAETNRKNPTTVQLQQLAGLLESDVVFLAGSTQEPEEEIVLEVFKRLQADWPDLRLIVVPRHPERFESVAKMLDESGVAWQRRTLLKQDRKTDARVLLVDAIGELGAWWGTARIAFVGGSLGNRGGQNMIEPAAYGAAVSFGPNTRNFRDIVANMLDHDAAIVVNNGSDLTDFARRCLKHPEYADQLGNNARQLVANGIGATERTVSLIVKLADSKQPKANQQDGCHR